MTDSRELLAMMTARGIRLGNAYGGVPSLTSLDVAGAMGMGHIPRREAVLLLVKYCDDRTMIHELWAYWFADRMQKAWREKWVRKRGDVEKLSRLTLEEHIDGKICKTCCGVGSVIVDSKKRDCHVCEGVGRRYAGEPTLADYFGVSRRQYRQVWEPRVADARGELNRWEIEAAEAVARALR